jgi:hypothetical protein
MKVLERSNIETREMEADHISIRQPKKGKSSRQAHTMNIPTNKSMDGRRKVKELWIGLVEVRALKRSEILGDAKGAFVNLVTWATDADEFKSNAELVFNKKGLFVIEIENPEPVSTRRKKAELDDEIEEIIDRAQDNPKAIIYGTFHTWKRDTA